MEPQRSQSETSSGEKSGYKETGYRTYILTWVAIIVLTAITFTLSRVGGGAIVLSLLIAGTQAGLALYFFMHLSAETGRVFKILIPLVLVILVVLMSLVFSDVAFRG